MTANPLSTAPADVEVEFIEAGGLFHTPSCSVDRHEADNPPRFPDQLQGEIQKSVGSGLDVADASQTAEYFFPMNLVARVGEAKIGLTYRQPTQLFINKRDGTFMDASAGAGSRSTSPPCVCSPRS